MSEDWAKLAVGLCQEGPSDTFSEELWHKWDGVARKHEACGVLDHSLCKILCFSLFFGDNNTIPWPHWCSFEQWFAALPVCLPVWGEKIKKLSLILLILKSSAVSMVTSLGKPVSTVCSGACWYLTQHRWLVKFSSFFFFFLSQKPQMAFFCCAGESDPSTDRRVGKGNV